jgi:hypothetical protein
VASGGLGNATVLFWGKALWCNEAGGTLEMDSQVLGFARNCWFTPGWTGCTITGVIWRAGGDITLSIRVGFRPLLVLLVMSNDSRRISHHPSLSLAFHLNSSRIRVNSLNSLNANSNGMRNSGSATMLHDTPTPEVNFTHANGVPRIAVHGWSSCSTASPNQKRKMVWPGGSAWLRYPAEKCPNPRAWVATAGALVGRFPPCEAL